MKELKIILITLLSIIAVGLVVTMIYLSSSGQNTFFVIRGGCKLVNQQELDISEINTIDINYTSNDIIFLKGDSDKLILKEYRADSVKDENAKINIDKKSNILSIIGSKTRHRITFISFGYSGSYVEIYLPEDCNKDLLVETSSGDIISQIALKSDQLMKLKSSSGDIKIKEAIAENINVESSSGNISMDKAEGNRSLKSNSGDVKLFDGRGNSTIRTKSGDITVENASGNLEIEASSGEVRLAGSNHLGGFINTKSGDITLELEALVDNLNLKSSSGECKLIISKKNSFIYRADTSSGDIKTFFDENLSFNKKGDSASGTFGNNATYTITMDTKSGDIMVFEE